MDEQQTGRSAILARRIYQLRKHIELCNSLPLAGASPELDENTLELERMLAELVREQTHKRVVLLGTEHSCQFAGNIGNADLRIRLDFLKEQFQGTMLMEEWSENSGPSFVSTLGMTYENVGTGPERQYRTYPSSIQYPGYDGTLDFDASHPSMGEYGPLDHQENRVRAMVEHVCTAMARHHVGILLIGLAHLHSMSQKLLAANFTVSAFQWLPSPSQEKPGEDTAPRITSV
ncbi:hypothetical protein [Granulicella sp. dw_53]|uniref:hypothetical protein n=1 Tax=Granulicella sp. dw_53 TaxID=2719792 RepID=UPI001BD31288|nr:hypothetical protein [Granulicella sp. dw_53]